MASVPSIPAQDRRSIRRDALRYGLGLLLAAACLFWTFRAVDVPRAWEVVTLLGPSLLLVFVPFFVSLGFDGLGWSRILSTLGHKVEPLRLASYRLSADALVLSVPGGAVLGETLKPVLVQRECGVPLSESVSVAAARKYFIIFGHGLFLGLGALLGWRFLTGSSLRLLGVSGLPLLLAGAAVGLLTLASVSRWMMRGGLAGRLGWLLQHLPLRPLQRWVEERRASFDQADGHLGRTLAPRSLGPPTLLYLGMWLAESLETFLLLHLLGLDVSWGDALAIEAVLSVLKALVFFVPAGLGVQDAGYATFIAGLSGAEGLHLAAAFVMVKRARELLCVGLGYTLLLRRRGRHLPGPETVRTP